MLSIAGHVYCITYSIQHLIVTLSEKISNIEMEIINDCIINYIFIILSNHIYMEQLTFSQFVNTISNEQYYNKNIIFNYNRFTLIFKFASLLHVSNPFQTYLRIWCHLYIQFCQKHLACPNKKYCHNYHSFSMYISLHHRAYHFYNCLLFILLTKISSL